MKALRRVGSFGEMAKRIGWRWAAFCRFCERTGVVPGESFGASGGVFHVYRQGHRARVYIGEPIHISANSRAVDCSNGLGAAGWTLREFIDLGPPFFKMSEGRRVTGAEGLEVGQQVGPSGTLLVWGRRLECPKLAKWQAPRG